MGARPDNTRDPAPHQLRLSTVSHDDGAFAQAWRQLYELIPEKNGPTTTIAWNAPDAWYGRVSWGTDPEHDFEAYGESHLDVVLNLTSLVREHCSANGDDRHEPGMW
jgi:hypothetical protein